jgi:indole-3-glycerol phosphate synthase/phosphoribosylanthranilate isomerase
MDFLSEIIAVKRQRLAAAKAGLPLDQIRKRAHEQRAEASPHAFAQAVGRDNRINLIAEFKRRSPSKGKINSDEDAAATARIYEAAGATAISVLTEEDYFAGSLEDLRRVRKATGLPILRKDFIFDEYQVYESAAAGADAILLIVAALDDQNLTRLRTIAEEELGLDALVEVHSKDELDRAVSCGARLIGVNNRDLRTFNVSVAVSEQLARAAPRDVILVSESGLNPAEVRKLRTVGYKGFLVGEALMRSDDPGAKLREFIEEPANIHAARSVWVKICGITNLEDARAAIEAGADMLGFNFYRRSPRFIEPQAAAEIVSQVQSQGNSMHRSVTLIGVFVDESIDEVLRIADQASLNGIQLHGDETAEFCEQLRGLSPQRFVIKAVRPNDAFSVEMLNTYPADAIMIDAFDPNLRGGTGRTADWEIASNAAKKLPRVFLAGGLSPENIAEAIAAIQPYGVDACSSLETSPGRKSAKRMREFVDAVRASKLPDEMSRSITGEGN